MKEYQASDIRNFAVVGHASAGKTMLCESMLACSGVINRLGSVASNSTVSDYHPGEQKRQISIHATPLHAEWMEKKFNLIDTPGYADFISDASASLRVADLALVVVGAADGVMAGTEKVWRWTNEYDVPKMVVLTGLDKENVNFDEALAAVRSGLGERVFPMTLPLNAGPGFNQVLDVMRSEVVTYKTDGLGKYEEGEASGDAKARVEELHGQLIEYIAESDDSLMEKFFEEGSLSEDELRNGLHEALQHQTFTPLFCVSGETNVGVARLMDFIAKYGASPVDRSKVKGQDASGNEVEVALTDSDPVIFVYKTLVESHVGELSLFRVYSGSVATGDELYNPSRNATERLGQMFLTNGKNRDSAGRLNAGDLGVVVKLKDTHTGDTLCAKGKSVSLPRVEYPQPNIHAALKVKSKGEEDKLGMGLSALHEEDVTFVFKVDAELHQTVISGQGELHLQEITDRLKQRFNVEVELREPRVPYRETIKSKADAKYRHKKQSGGAGQFAEVWLRIEPKPRNEGNEFIQTLTGQNVDRGFVPSVEKGFNAACSEGILASCRVVDVKVDFYDGKMHPVDSKDIAFQIAGKEAFKDAFKQAKPCLLEPVFSIEVNVPDECMGNVMGDLSSRRGRITSMDAADGNQIIKAQIPQKELYGYSTQLRSLTGGRASHTEEFSHYEEMPKDLELKAIEEAKRMLEEEE